jgi:hypothetical protein
VIATPLKWLMALLVGCVPCGHAPYEVHVLPHCSGSSLLLVLAGAVSGMVYEVRELLLAGTAAVVRINPAGEISN